MTRHQRSKRVWAKWGKLVTEQVGSGRSVAVFCQERRLCAAHFFAWKKRLREAATRRQAQGDEATQFVEVKLAAVAPAAWATRGAASTAGESRVEIRLANGRSLLVDRGFDAQHLRAVLAVVEAAE
jgi:hypothetical protein